MMSAAWSNDGAEAFANSCRMLNLHGATVAEVAKLVERLPMLTFYADGVAVGGMVFVNRGVHIGIDEEWRKRWVTKSILQEIQSALRLARVAHIQADNADAIAFAESLGWKRQGTENGYAVYRPSVA